MYRGWLHTPYEMTGGREEEKKKPDCPAVCDGFLVCDGAFKLGENSRKRESPTRHYYAR